MNVSQEHFDVVDENDRVIGIQTRSDVHRMKLRHRAIHVFVRDPLGHLLIHKRSPSKEEFPSVWTSSCSGHVSSGETYDDAAPRELFEELGIQAPLARLYRFSACPDTSFEFTVLYHAESADVVCPDPDEITEVRWMSLADIAAWIQSAPEDFSPAFRLLFAWYVATGTDGHPGLAILD